MINKLLLTYSGILTLVIAVVLLTGFSRSSQFDEITVQRINIVEPDKTLRMVLSNHAKLPGIIVRGKEQEFDRPQAGMLFFNDEGSENGGLIFGGKIEKNGDVVNSGGSLSFDKYDANQIVQLIGVDDKEDRFAGLIVGDSQKEGKNTRRIWVGRDETDTASVALMDVDGKKRLLLEVEKNGNPRITFLDADGKITSRFPAKSVTKKRGITANGN